MHEDDYDIVRSNVGVGVESIHKGCIELLLQLDSAPGVEVMLMVKAAAERSIPR